MYKRLLAADPSIPAGRVLQNKAVLLADRAAAGALQPKCERRSAMRVGIATDHGGFGLKRRSHRQVCLRGA